MPRKPEPSFTLKQIIWDMAGTIGTDNWSALYREVNRKLEELRDRGELLEDVPEERKVRDIIELDIQRVAREVVMAKLPRHTWHLRNDYEAIERVAESVKIQQQKPQEAVVEQEPYEETSHKLKIREVAKALAETISLPSTWDKDLWRDLPIEFQPGKYSLSIGVAEIADNGQMKVSYYRIGAGNAEPHLVKGLFNHLNTSGLSEFAGIVGDKGKPNNLVGKAGQYSQALLMFLKLIADEVKGYRAKVNFHDEPKPGLTKWFIITVWNDVIQKASGHSWIDDSWYKPPESIPDTSLWQLKCGSYGISIARSKKTLATYKNWHKKLRVKHAEHPLAIDIAVKDREMGNIAQEIRQQLQKFSDMEHLPGHCELCQCCPRC